MITIEAFVSGRESNSPQPGKTNRRIRLSLVPLKEGEKQALVENVGGTMVFELQQPTVETYDGFKDGQRVKITIEPV